MNNTLLRRTIICLAPVIAAVWVILWAWFNDRFKLGVDLSGGTILVYEIDPRKKTEDDKEKDKDKDKDMASDDPTARARADANLLAKKLKERIDPTDTYNIIIRPAGGENRVEIILPTGGVARAKKAEKDWQDLLKEMEDRYKEYGVKLDVGRGRPKELADAIQQQVSEHIWATKLFGTQQQLDALGKKANKSLDALRNKRGQDHSAIQAQYRDLHRAASIVGLTATASALDPTPLRVLVTARMIEPVYRLPLVGDDEFQLPAELIGSNTPASLRDLKATSFKAMVAEAKKRVGDYTKEKEIEAWFREQAWKELSARVWDKFFVERYAKNKEEWAKLKGRKSEFDNILPDHYEELIGRVVLRGNVLGQGFVSALEPVLGRGYLTGEAFLPRKEVKDFIVANYGPSDRDIESEIEKINKSSGRRRDSTIEDVQRIKDLIAKVGKLEFRILANSHDDKQAIDDAKDLLGTEGKPPTPEMARILKERQEKGLPPLAPRTSAKHGVYKINLARGANSFVTYTWVELGPQERQQLGLHNNAKNEPGRGAAWSYLATRRNLAVQLTLPGDNTQRFMLQGALFYSRECLDRNLSEEERREKKVEYFMLTRDPEWDMEKDKRTPDIDGNYLSHAQRDDREGRPAVSFVFKPAGGDLFGTLTRKNVPSGGSDESSQIKRHLAIVLDGLIMSAPTINSEIRTHGQISGSFTGREVDQLVNILRAGALPATLKPQPVSESTIGATLGQDTIRAGVTAIGLAFLVVLAFMIVYYRFAGLVASVALLANLLLTVAFMVAVQATFTLPGIAGLVLTVGMAVDANVLIYERLREERDRGASLALAIRNGYDRSFGTIIDTHLGCLFTAIVLYIMGNDQLKGFGVSLAIGLLISLFTSLYMTRLLFDIWLHKGWLTKLGMFRLFARTDIDFMGVRRYWFTASIILTIVGFTLFLARIPDNLNIDFRGGTAYAGQLEKGYGQDITGLRKLLDEKRQKEMLQVASVTQIDTEGRSFRIEYADPPGSREVNLANQPLVNNPNATKAEREADLIKRAGELPDVSVEQIFLSAAESNEEDAATSRFFNARTTEREPDLVQATLDRLLRVQENGEWKDMLKKIRMTYDKELLANGRETDITFTEMTDAKQGMFASLSFVKTLLTRELLKAFGMTKTADLPFFMEMTGKGQSLDGRFREAKLTFSPTGASLSEDDIGKIRTALDRTQLQFTQRPQPERLEVFDPQLAAETRLRAMWAILVSWGAILLYLWFRFGNWTFGLAAVLCLVHDVVLTLGAICACHYVYLYMPGVARALLIEDFKIDLTTIAALLTLVGYSINDKIVVYDRMREVRGKKPELTAEIINDSINQALSRTMMTGMSVLLVLLVLYIFGGEGVHLFAFVMVIGLFVGTYSSIYVASPLLLIFGEGARAASKHERQPQPERKAADVRIQPAGP
jgi:SecD/SecF fusion protein